MLTNQFKSVQMTPLQYRKLPFRWQFQRERNPNKHRSRYHTYFCIQMFSVGKITRVLRPESSGNYVQQEESYQDFCGAPINLRRNVHYNNNNGNHVYTSGPVEHVFVVMAHAADCQLYDYNRSVRGCPSISYELPNNIYTCPIESNEENFSKRPRVGSVNRSGDTNMPFDHNVSTYACTHRPIASL